MRDALILLAILMLSTVMFAISYVLTVGTTWLALYLAHLLWQFTWHPNVWVLGAFVWVVMFVLRGTFSSSKK